MILWQTSVQIPDFTGFTTKNLILVGPKQKRQFMKKSSIFPAFLLFLLLLTSTACGEQCTAPDLAENIVGNWRIIPVGINVELRADGSLIDPDGGLIEGELNGVVLDEKSYEVLGADLLKVRAESGNQFLEVEYAVPSNFCDELRMNGPLGLELNLIRQ